MADKVSLDERALARLDTLRGEKKESLLRAPAKKSNGQAYAKIVASVRSEDAMALAFVERHGAEFRYIPPWHKWVRWDGKKWRDYATTSVYATIRTMIREAVAGTKVERKNANAAFVSGVERLARTDQTIVVLPEHLDADPWALNTQSGIVDLRTGLLQPHDPGALLTRITAAGMDADQGRKLWARFLADITQGDAALAAYLQRVAGYCSTGITTEDLLVYLFGIGANGKSSFAEAVASALGDYALTFSPEVLMEAKGERHPTELAQFLGARFALSSEPASNAVWNDARVKALTGDACITARFMRGDNFTFARTHKTFIIGNHLPRLNTITHAIKRRVQLVPFRAVFTPAAGPGMREKLKAQALGAILTWVVAGAVEWQKQGTCPPAQVRQLTDEYLSDEDEIGQWLAERCERQPQASELSSRLHQDYSCWCDHNHTRCKSNKQFSEHLVSAGFERRPTMVGKCFFGLKLRAI